MDVPAPPSVPGFALETLVRFSRSGETWLARRVATGNLESLTLVRGALVSTAEPLTRFRHPHVVPVTEVVAAGRNVALLSPVPPPLTLASLSVGRPVLDPGEVVGLGVPLAQALAAAHDRGIVHGDLDPVDVVIGADGAPALLGLGIADLSGAGVAPADDVHALALILRSLLGDDAGPRAEAIRGALGAALSGHPAARPEAGELAGLLSITCPPQPLRGLPRELVPSPPVAPPASSRHALPRGLHPSSTAVTATLAVLGVLLLLLAAPLFGGSHHNRVSSAPDVPAPLVSSPPAAPPATVAPPATTAPMVPVVSAQPAARTATQWQHTLQRLVTARDKAFAGLGPTALVDAPGSSAAAIDADRIASLRSAKVHASGLVSTITGVAVTTSGAHAVALTFEESASSYDLVTGAGAVIEHRPAAAKQKWSATLVNGSKGWRTARVQRGTGDPG